MNNIALTIEQMNELEDMGFDIADASMYYWLSIPINLSYRDDSITFIRNRVGKWCLNGNENWTCTPTYTLSDLIKKLPRYIQPYLESEVWIANGINEDKWKLRIEPAINDKWYVRYVMNDYYEEEYHCDDTYHTELGDTLIDAVFKMLKWLKVEETKRNKINAK